MTLMIDPERYYSERSLRALYDLDGRALREAREGGHLRHKRVGAEVWYKGAWIKSWLDGDAPGTGGRAAS